MRVAFTVLDKEKDDLDERFGRAEYFAIYDTDTQETEIVENEAKNDAGGAGGKAVRILYQNKVDVIISGDFGPKALEALKGFEIKAYKKGLSVKISEALYKWGQNELEEVMESTVKAHNGLRKA